jgi:hypothetical protein
MNPRAQETVRARPAESSAVAAALALLIVSLAGVDDPAVLTALGVLIGAIPAFVTSIVEWRRRGK